MIKPKKYDEIEIKEYGNYKTLPLGGHKMVIARAYTDETTTFRPTLNLELDIADDGEFKWYFSKIYQEDTSSSKKWQKAGTYSVITDDDEKTLPFFKGLITSIEKSNPNYKFDWNLEEEKQLKSLEGKMLGAIYGLEEYENEKGEIKTSRKIRFIRSIDNIETAPIPDVKLIDKTYMSYDDYEEMTQKTNNLDEKQSNLEEKKEFINTILEL